MNEIDAQLSELDGDIIDEAKESISAEPEAGIEAHEAVSELFKMNRKPVNNEEFLEWYKNYWKSIEEFDDIKVFIDDTEVAMEYIIGE